MSAPGGFTRAITSLSHIEDRLRRALGLVGEVGATFTPGAIPVVQVFDATAPGNNLQRGRRFHCSYHDTGAAVNVIRKFRFNQAVVIDEMILHATAFSAGSLQLRIIPRGAADAGVTYGTIATFLSNWAEGPSSTTDKPPVDVNTAAGVQLAGSAWLWMPQTASVMPQFVVRDIHFEQGTAISIENAGVETTTNLTVQLRGHVY